MKTLVIEKVGGTTVPVVVSMCWASTQKDLDAIAHGMMIAAGKKQDSVRYIGVPGSKAIQVEGKWYVPQQGECLLEIKKQALAAMRNKELIQRTAGQIAEIERILAILKSMPSPASV